MDLLGRFRRLNRVMEEMLDALNRDDMDRFWELDRERDAIFEEIRRVEIEEIPKELFSEVERAKRLTEELSKLAEKKKGEVGIELERIGKAKRILSGYKPSIPTHPRFLDIKE